MTVAAVTAAAETEAAAVTVVQRRPQSLQSLPSSHWSP